MWIKKSNITKTCKEITYITELSCGARILYKHLINKSTSTHYVRVMEQDVANDLNISTASYYNYCSELKKNGYLRKDATGNLKAYPHYTLY